MGKQIGCPGKTAGLGKADRNPRAKMLPNPSQEGVMEMKDLFTKMKTFIADEEGASAVEYGLLVAGIAVVVMTAIYTIGTNLNTKYTSVAGKLAE
jgi:pilus assembly protein Flp/PilA